MAAQNPNYGFSNFNGEIPFTTTASATYHGDVILQDGGIGVVHGGLAFDPIASGTAVSLRIEGAVTGLTKLAGVAWSVGAELFWDPVNLGLTNVPTLYPAGMATTAQLTGDTTAAVLLNYVGRGGLIGSAAQVTGITGTTEAVQATINIPANLLIPGDVLEIEGDLAATGQNSTDTLETRIRIGGLSGTVVADTGAVQCASGTGIKVRARLQVGAVSATVGTLYGAGDSVAAATAKTVAASVTGLNNTAAIAVAITTAFSSSSASDTCNLNAFTVRRIA